jgi:hypothetical protein
VAASPGLKLEMALSKTSTPRNVSGFMKSATRLASGLAVCLVVGIFVGGWWPGAKAAADNAMAEADKPESNVASSWDPKAAAAYLDQRQSWWMEWPKAQRDHETFCVSCHTAVPYALSRSALRPVLGEQGASPNEQRLLSNVTKRVRLWNEVEPFYKDADRGPYKSVESRGTESVLNALILAGRDVQGGQLSNDARNAFKNMWAEQQTAGKQKGAWLWLRFKNEPWEADDSDYFGATLAAVAVGIAPGNYRAAPEIQPNLKLLQEYLNREFTAQTTMNRVLLLWADAKLPGLLSGISPEDANLKQGLAWLTANQDKTQGSWTAYSLNKNKEHHISPETALFMNDAATSYAVLSLTAANRR